MEEDVCREAVFLIDVGRIYRDRGGGGRMYLPKTVMDAADFKHKDHLKLEVKDNTLKAVALRGLK